MENNTEIKLDYSIQSPIERTQLVRKITESYPKEKLTPKFLELLSNYIIFAMDKEQKRSKKINTQNRMITVNKRETSFQGLVSKFENGEDGIYNMVIDNDKNVIMTPKVSITEQDLKDIPPLKQLHDAIENLQKKEKLAVGKKRYILKQQIIAMRKDQYVIKNSYKQPIYMSHVIKNFNNISFPDKISFNEDGSIHDESIISFMNPKHISALLCNYSRLKQDCYGRFLSDGYYLMEDLDKLIDRALKDKYPLYYSLMIYKIDGQQNITIQKLLQEEHGVKHSVEYISALWRNKIPKLIAEQAEKDYLEWYFSTQEKGIWKKCSRCGEIKLAHNKFFSRNTSSKDGYYSICKSCRNKKTPKTTKIVKKISYRKG